MLIFNEGDTFSRLIVDIIKEDETGPTVDKHTIYSYPEDSWGYAHWGDINEKSDLHSLAEGIQIDLKFRQMPKEDPSHPPSISKDGDEFRLIAQNRRIRLDGDLLYHIVLPDNFYVDRTRCRKETCNEIVVVTRKKQKRQTVTCLLAAPGNEIDETIFFKGPDKEGFNSQEERYEIYSRKSLRD
jgi:hypothetical protein